MKSKKVTIPVVLVLLAVLAIGIPRFIRLRTMSAKAACIANLKQIESAKEQWALEGKKEPSDTPPEAELIGPDKYIRVKPVCPDGGSYTIWRMDRRPTCSIGGVNHTLPR